MADCPSMPHQHATTLGNAYSRNGSKPFGINPQDRAHHIYVLGQTGTGKSTLLRTMALQDAKNGQGFCLIDPHGDLAKDVFKQAGTNCLHWDIADPTSPLGYNPLTRIDKSLRPLIASGFIDTLKHQWADAWGPRMESLLRWSLLALLDQPKATVADIMPLLTNKDFRKQVIANIEDEECKRFWVEEYTALSYKTAFDGAAPIANKLSIFLSHPVIRKALTHPKIPLRFRKIMDEGQTLIVNLSKGRLGSEAVNIMGGLIVAGFRNAAFTREDQPEGLRKPYSILIDEFHNFTTETIAESLSELRKYHVNLTLSQQHSKQSDPKIRQGLMGNIGTSIIFRLGLEDADYFARYLQFPRERDLLNLPNHLAYCRLMIDGVQSKAFSMETIPP